MNGILDKMTAKENSKILKRNKIIDSASLLFSRKSYHEVMMEEVAKLASIAKGTVYNYFSSKEELYFSIMKGRMEKLNSSLTEKISQEKSSLDSLRSFVLHIYMFMMKYQNFFLMYRKESLNAEHHLCTELIDLDKGLRLILIDIIRRGKQENIFRDIEEEFSADLILGSIYGAVHRGIENNVSDDRKITEREKIYDFVLHGLFSGFRNNEMLPLKNKTIVITRAVETSKESAEIFIQLGGNVITFPTLDIAAPESWDQFDSFILSKTRIDFIIFTSAHAVAMFKKRLEELNFPFSYSRTRVVAVGNKTAALCEKFNIPVNIVPREFSSEGVIYELLKYRLSNKVIFIPRSAIGREELPKSLEELGAVIKAVPVYNVTVPSDEVINYYKGLLDKSKPDVFIFTSPSTFENYLQINKITDPEKYFNGADVAAIGPTTRTAIELKNVRVQIMPDEYTIEGLAKAILKFYKKNEDIN